ncbi:MAG: 2-succinyl-5-enolpyruvyl-6-hydroxy-3-cyclohexene-1-carboxylate synthase [Flavobacteriaceae bacterium]|jgi:2-succinyl-5-enolpyruvyl-6-hydroxy-3-cyclohexene-1-carboxylate synthase
MKTKNSGSSSIKYPEIPLAQTVVQLCQMKGIHQIVICAGSRNAPLTNGFVENTFFKTYSIVDERSAAFFAMGMAQQLNTPTAVVCTSGSALLNFYPAVAEAFYSNIPLVVISADRMPHRIDIGDGQTIQQKGVFEPHLVDFAYLSPDVTHAADTLLENPNQRLIPPKATLKQIENKQQEIQKENEKQINGVLNHAIQKSGPVHLNVPMEEPLYGMTTSPIEITQNTAPELSHPKVDFKTFKKQWQKAEKKLILVGVNDPNGIDQQWLDLIDADPSVILMTETTSNLRSSNAINSIDSLIAPLETSNPDFFKTLKPQILLTFGGMVVSKKIKKLLRDHSPQEHWHVDPYRAYDTYYCLTQHFSMPVNAFFSELLIDYQSPETHYKSSILDQYQAQIRQGNAYLRQIPFSDLKAFETIFSKLPEQIHLQLANSSTVRYAQLFDMPQQAEVFSNRGTSGIDGSTATAVGAALINQNSSLLVTGDLSFFYDINGLWNDHIPSNFRVILINNQGGGIFRILPGEKDSPKYDTYFETIHGRDARQISKAFGFHYKAVKTNTGLKWALKNFFKPSRQPKILEIKTPRKINDSILLNYFKAMQKS